MYKHERYAARVAAGVCYRCGKNPAAPGKRSCEECLVRQRASARYRYRQLVKQGICALCRHEKATVGYVTCDACRVKNILYSRIDYARDHHKEAKS